MAKRERRETLFMGYPCHSEAIPTHTHFFLSLSRFFLPFFPLPGQGLSKSRAPELKKKGQRERKKKTCITHPLHHADQSQLVVVHLFSRTRFVECPGIVAEVWKREQDKEKRQITFLQVQQLHAYTYNTRIYWLFANGGHDTPGYSVMLLT